MQSLNNIYILHIKRQIFWLSVKAAASGVMWYCETQPSFEKGAINYHFLEQQREFKIGVVQEQRRQKEHLFPTFLFLSQVQGLNTTMKIFAMILIIPDTLH